MRDGRHSSTHYYDGARVVLSYGPIVVRQLADGVFFEASYIDSQTEFVRGCEGETLQLDALSMPGRIRVHVMPGDPFNTYMSAHLAADLLTRRGILPFSMIDPNGGDLVICPRARLSAMPDMKKGSVATDRVVWEWYGEPMLIHYGSLARAGSEIDIPRTITDPLAGLLTVLQGA